MMLNLFGSYEVPFGGEYVVELMARRGANSQVLVENIEYDESDRGQIIVELYRPYSSVQSALRAGRASSCRHGSRSLQSKGRARPSLAAENLTGILRRFTLQNDGLYRAARPQRVFAYQDVSYSFGSQMIRKGGTTDVVAMHFTNAPTTRTVAYLSSSQTLTGRSDLTFAVSEPTRRLFSVSGQHKAGDILRAQSQVQLEMIAGETGAACWARIAIYENGTLTYRSILDERFVRNSSNKRKDHDAAAFAPFAVYKTRHAGDHRVTLITDCNATKAATMRAKDYGRHLSVDHFTMTAP